MPEGNIEQRTWIRRVLGVSIATETGESKGGTPAALTSLPAKPGRHTPQARAVSAAAGAGAALCEECTVQRDAA